MDQSGIGRDRLNSHRNEPICSVCHKPIVSGTTLGEVCESPKCLQQFRFNNAQRMPRCAVCRVFLSASEKVSGTCGAQSCRSRKSVDDQFRRSQEHRQLQKEKVSQLADEDAETKGISLPESHDPVLVPFIGRNTTKVSTDRKEEFLVKLKNRIEDNFHKFPDTPTQLPEEDHGESVSVTAKEMIGRACATCEGFCCRFGESQVAYIGEATLLRYRFLHPEVTAEEIHHNYANQIGEVTYESSCLYHGPQGCTLPDEMRSAVCNRYVCQGVTDMLVQLEIRPETVGYVAAIDMSSVRKITPLRAG